jgi:regulator of nucleoside diphosphate kinase
MKPRISKTDFDALHALLIKQADNMGKSLGQEMEQAIIVDEKELDKSTVRLNSHVEVKDLSTKKVMNLQIVMPDLADLSKKRISVFAPISVALIGFKENDTVSWTLPQGVTDFKIVKVKN